MKLQELFDRDIHRHINPAVTVSDSKAETIKAEIEEYVFTDDLIEQFFLMLDTVLNRKQGKTGIWINGYYGSGKSHFIKYVHYLLNADTQALAFDMLEKAVEGYDGMRSGAIRTSRPRNSGCCATEQRPPNAMTSSSMLKKSRMMAMCRSV